MNKPVTIDASDLRWLAQTIHNAYHTEDAPRWQLCRKTACLWVQVTLTEHGAMIDPASPTGELLPARPLRDMILRLYEAASETASSTCQEFCVHSSDDPKSCPLNDPVLSEARAWLAATSS